MKLSEWLDIATDISDRWPHSPMPEETIRKWGEDLADLDAEAVTATIEVLYREGREFAPNAGVIRKRLAELIVDVPEWSWVVTELRSAHSRAVQVINPTRASEEDPLGHEYPRRERLERSGPLVTAFVEHCGWTQVAAGLDGGNGEARLRQKWEQFTDRAKEQVVLQGIEGPPSMKALARIAGGQAHGELRQGGGVADVRRQIEAAKDKPQIESEIVEAEVVE